jgi:hypothetical protein
MTPMKDEDLEPFAVADGLLAKMEDQPPAGQVTDTERQWMLDQARENLARVLNVSAEVAGRELHVAAVRGEVTEQYSAHLAVIAMDGRILYVVSRVGLRGAAHPERN